MQLNRCEVEEPGARWADCRRLLAAGEGIALTEGGRVVARLLPPEAGARTMRPRARPWGSTPLPGPLPFAVDVDELLRDTRGDRA